MSEITENSLAAEREMQIEQLCQEITMLRSQLKPEEENIKVIEEIQEGTVQDLKD